MAGCIQLHSTAHIMVDCIQLHSIAFYCPLTAHITVGRILLQREGALQQVVAAVNSPTMNGREVQP